MATFVPRRILGKWREGFSLDLHTLSSVFVGYDEFGHSRFDTKRSEIGELLYALKNKADQRTVPELVHAAERLLREWNPPVQILVPVPPSTRRAVQPVLVLARAIGERLGMPVVDCVTRTRDIPQLKNIYDLDERAKLLDGLHAVDESATRGRTVLLFDDLFRSGATMNAITTELYERGKATDVFAFTITRTRSNQ